MVCDQMSACSKLGCPLQCAGTNKGNVMQKLEDHNCCLMFEVEWEVRANPCDLTAALFDWQPAVASQPLDQLG